MRVSTALLGRPTAMSWPCMSHLLNISESRSLPNHVLPDALEDIVLNTQHIVPALRMGISEVVWHDPVYVTGDCELRFHR